MHTIRRRARWELPSVKDIAPFAALAPGGLRRQLVRFFDLLLTWQERAAQRQALRQFDDRMMRDIGVSRADVERECRKPFWRP